MSMKVTSHQTIVLPQDPAESAALLDRLLSATDAEQAWKEAHANHAGPTFEMTTEDDEQDRRIVQRFL